jgi:hypothetical protein
MVKNKKSGISKAASYREMSDYWDTHDLSDHWDKGKDVRFDVDINSEVTYCALERDLSEKVQEVAKRHGVSSDTIVNMWVQDRLTQETKKPLAHAKAAP